MDNEEFKKIAIIENDVEAILIDSILSELEIPHIMRSYYDTAYDGLFQTQKGWGHVSAPEHFRENILSIIEHIRKNAEILDED